MKWVNFKIIMSEKCGNNPMILSQIPPDEMVNFKMKMSEKSGNNYLQGYSYHPPVTIVTWLRVS